MNEQIYCVLDYETYSEVDLKRCGAWEYSVHPSTQIICVAWRLGTRETLKTTETRVWYPHSNYASAELDWALISKSVILVAHNAYFEQVITQNVLFCRNSVKEFQPERWLCTASHAAALALPRNLEGAANALKLPVTKDMEGRKLVLKWCKPRKATKNNSKTRHDDPKELARLVEYCKRDVDTEVELFLRTPPLTPTERKVWILDQRINLRGFKVDRPLVTKVLSMIDDETKEINRKTREVSGGIVSSANQRDGVLKLLECYGTKLPDLRKGTVDAALKSNDLGAAARKLLEYRAAISKTSTAKFQAFEIRSRHDSRVRDILLYHAASTGRWGGVGVQPQNLPRAKIKNTDLAAKILLEDDLEMVRMIYGDPMQVFSDCIRSVIIPSPGRVFDVADYAAIETRVLFWVAEHTEGLRAFREGRDLYREQAAKVFGKPVDKIAKDSFERFVGKGLILGCGYAMGPKKFADTCASQGREINESLAKIAVESYRTTHSPVVRLWDNINRAAIAAVNNVGKKYTINKTSWFVQGDFLYCSLPSGRRLAYYGPTVRWEPTPWGEKRATLFHFSVDPLSRKWTEAKTYGGKLVENVVQAIARDLMAEAMLRIEAAGPWRIVLSVHDELVAERDIFGSATTEHFCELMTELPDWAEGCPVTAEGWSGYRYRK